MFSAVVCSRSTRRASTQRRSKAASVSSASWPRPRTRWSRASGRSLRWVVWERGATCFYSEGTGSVLLLWNPTVTSAAAAARLTVRIMKDLSDVLDECLYWNSKDIPPTFRLNLNSSPTPTFIPPRRLWKIRTWLPLHDIINGRRSPPLACSCHNTVVYNFKTLSWKPILTFSHEPLCFRAHPPKEKPFSWRASETRTPPTGRGIPSRGSLRLLLQETLSDTPTAPNVPAMSAVWGARGEVLIMSEDFYFESRWSRFPVFFSRSSASITWRRRSVVLALGAAVFVLF